MIKNQTKYFMSLWVLLLRGWYVLSFFSWVNFQKQYSDPQEIQQTQMLYGWTNTVKQWIRKRNQSSSSEQLTQETITQAIQNTLGSGETYNNASTSISFDDIIASITTDSIINSGTSTKELEDQYKVNKDSTIAIALITQLSKESNFTRAYEIFEELDSTTIKSINPHLTMRILFNSKLVDKQTQDLNLISNMINELSVNNLLSSKDAQRYKAIIMILQWDKEAFINNLPEYTDNEQSDLAPLVKDIRQKINQSTQGHDIPSYYSDGLIALWMFQYGYPFVAQQLSLELLVEYPNYILPKQILAYSYMILHDWSKAQSYFLQLIETDPKNVSTYQFFAWVCSYRLGKYTDAVLYLNQITQDKLVSDAVRYKILSYIAIKDWLNVAKQMKALLWYTDINNSDMMLTWETIIFEPFMSDQPYEILLQDTTLLSLYIERCQNQWLDQTICNIWQIAKDISSNTANYSDTYLKGIISEFPRSYMYYILGDYYYKQGDTSNAQKSYISAISLTNNQTIREKISNRIKTLL